MFKKKYIFETRHTRYFRYLKNLSLIFLVLGFFYVCSVFVFILSAKKTNTQAMEEFFRKSPDLIAVFTGDVGRIPFALKKAQEYKQSHIFITGVYSKNSVDTLLKPLKTNLDLDYSQLKIDYLARNTVENVLSTYRYLRNEKGIEKVLIISHDYHILRIQYIIERLRASTDEYEFFFYGIQTDYKSMRNLKILFSEVFKFIRTSLFLQMWDQDIASETVAPRL